MKPEEDSLYKAGFEDGKCEAYRELSGIINDTSDEVEKTPAFRKSTKKQIMLMAAAIRNIADYCLERSHNVKS